MHWPRWIDHDGVVRAAPRALYAGEQVMWPYVQTFTDRLRPTVRSEAERVAGPLSPGGRRTQTIGPEGDT